MVREHPHSPALGRSVDRAAGGALGARLGRAVARAIKRMVVGFVSKFRAVVALAPLTTMGAAGCESPAESAAATASKVVAPPPVVADEEATPRRLGSFHITFYYVVGEHEVAAKLAPKAPANSNASVDMDLAGISGEPPVPPESQPVTLYHGKGCKPIAEVSRAFAKQLALQGTGKLKNGRVLNVWGPCNCPHSPCFQVTRTKWGTGGTGRALQPFRTVAVDRSVIKLGSLLYIPELEGRTMPGRPPWGGFVHDGCVVADDTGGGIRGNQLDLFVGRKPYLNALSKKGGSHAWARDVEVFDGSKVCERDGRRVGRRAAAI